MRAIDADRLLQVLEINFGHTGGADVMRQLIEAQPTLTPPNEWVSVEERLPEHMKDVIVLYGGGGIDIDWVDSLGDFRFDNLFGRVTHWMPLPAPPAKEGDR